MRGALLWILECLSQALQVLSQNGSNGYLTAGIGAFSSAYSVCRGIASSICRPIAYTLLTIFLLLDLYEVTTHLYQQGGGGLAAPVAGIKSVIKLAMVKWAIDSSSTLLGGIFDVAVSITARIGGTSALSMGDLTGRMQTFIENTDIGILEGIGYFALMLLALIAAWLAIIGITYVILSRFVQCYFYVALAPIPMSFFAQSHTVQMGLGYFKGFAGVALQSAVIALAIKLYPSFASAITLADDNLGACCLHVAMLSIILLGTIFGSSQVAQRVFGG